MTDAQLEMLVVGVEKAVEWVVGLAKGVTGIIAAHAVTDEKKAAWTARVDAAAAKVTATPSE